MKATLFSVASCLVAVALSNPCPFAEMQKSGLLSSEDSVKFDMVKRDPAAAERLLHEHRNRYKRSSDEHEEILPRQTNSGGFLGILPLGGGLGT